MARLPDYLADKGEWGNVLNEFELVSHNPDGTIKPEALAAGVVGTAGQYPTLDESGVVVWADAPRFDASHPRWNIVNDTQVVSSGSMTSGSATLTIGSALFTADDVGKIISVTGAGASGAQLFTTITGYISATQVTLAVTASTTVSSKYVTWGTDNQAALAALVSACSAANGELYIPAHMTLCIGSTLSIRYIEVVRIDGIIKVLHTSGVGVEFGNSSVVVRNTRIIINEISYPFSSTQTNIAARAIGIKGGMVTLNLCPYLQLYANHADPTATSIAYTQWHFGKVDKHELYGEPGGQSWVNENQFFGGRITTLLVTGTDYQHNHNKWYDPNLESSTITFTKAWNNYIYGARTESGATITFDAGSMMNYIETTWYSNDAVTRGILTVTDNGYRNIVTGQYEAVSWLRTIIRADSASRITNTGSPWRTTTPTSLLRPGFRKIQNVTALSRPVDTGIFPIKVVSGDGGVSRLSQMRFQSDAILWRPIVQVFDVNRQRLDGSGGQGYIGSYGGWTWTASLNGYSWGANQNDARIIFNHPDVHYARIFFYGVGTGWFEFAELQAFVEPGTSDAILDFIKRQIDRPLGQTGTTPPTQSLLPKYDTIATDTGYLRVTERVDTELTAAAAASATSITVASITNIAAGDTIAVELDDATTHFTTVSGAPAGSTVTLTAGLPSAAAIGRQVATQRWLHIV